MKNYDVKFKVNSGHGEHVINTQFNLDEIKKFGLKEVIRYNAKRLNLGDKFGCHVDFGDDDKIEYKEVKRSNCIGNLISKEDYNRVYSLVNTQ